MLLFSHKPQGAARLRGNEMLYEIEYAVANVIEKIELTYSALSSAVFSAHYSVGEFIYELRELWS